MSYQARKPPRRLALLLGSGISIPAQMPTVGEITARVLSGAGVMHHTDGLYYFGEPLYAHMGFPDEHVPRVVMFLRRLNIEVELYYLREDGTQTSYEDLHHIAAQIRDSESGEYDNPIVRPFLQRILPEVRPLIAARRGETRRRWGLQELAAEATNYIQDVVRNLLARKPCRTDHLEWLMDACRDAAFPEVDLFTLNHDTVLESCLSRSNIHPVDGFLDPVNGVRYWSPASFDDDAIGLRLFKLHGSVNWFRLRSDDGVDTVGIPVAGDPWHTVAASGGPQLAVEGRPMLLAGTFNKIMQYPFGLFAELHYRFYRRLEDVQCLLVCGYGFGDKGINTRLIEWMASSADRRMVVVHPRPDMLKQSARPAISRNWDNWKRDGRLSFVVSRAEDALWSEIRSALNP
jgi:hypothetical protein